MSNGASTMPETPATRMPAEADLRTVEPASPSAPAGPSQPAPQPQDETTATAETFIAAAAAPVSGDAPIEVGDALDKTTIDYLKSLRRGDGPSVLERAVGMYLENAPTVLEELRRAVAGGDASAVWKIAHSLKSSSASLGAKQLAQHIGDMEGRARQNDLVEADSRLVRIETEFRKASSALRQTLREEKERCRQTA